ncbi:MAG: hypothetical protein ACLUNO_01710 [Oscillospiraceae bacterium]
MIPVSRPSFLAGGGAQAAVELLRTVSPQYLGAVVVCDGADAPQVQLAVTQAVAQFTGLSTDRISVCSKSSRTRDLK